MSGGRLWPGRYPGRWLAVLALALAVLAPLAGPPDRVVGPGVDALTRELGAGDAHLDPVTLGTWIRDRRPVTLLDLRDASEFTRFSIPTATSSRFEDLSMLPRDTARAVVLYDDGAGDAVRGWLLLRRLGHPRVWILDGGVVGWIDGVVSPVLPAGTPAERDRYQRVAEVSRYFGGMPRVGEPPPRSGRSAEEAVQLLSRRGCY